MRQKLNKNLGYVTQITEKIMLAVIAIMTLVAAGIDVWGMIWATRNIQLADLFLDEYASNTGASKPGINLL